MLIIRTPLRISFFGGGTDYPSWFNQDEGSVINASINRYSYITSRWLPPFFEYKHRIRYYEKEETQTLDEIKHPSIRECAKFLEINKGIEIVHNSDLPSRTGLGSSSSFTVGMLHSLYTLKNIIPTKRELAEKAIHIEQNVIKEAVGSQDQVAAAFGGFNLINFKPKNNFDVTPIIINEKRLNQLQEKLLLCFTGFTRNAHDIASKQIELTSQNSNELKKINLLCQKAFNLIIDEKKSINDFGYLLNEQWEIKRSLTKHITKPYIDEIYKTGLQNGAIGGKLLGAGGGGFMLFFANKDRHKEIKHALKKYMFVPFQFEFTGSKLVYFSHSHE
tara:strand:- start:607 stop:1602 length:996 start_codon:yes stop_codon:yes gene_type:complete